MTILTRKTIDSKVSNIAQHMKEICLINSENMCYIYRKTIIISGKTIFKK